MVALVPLISGFGIATSHPISPAMEVKWSREKDKFPESQATAYAHLFLMSGCIYASWLPVFVLSKGHFQCGIEFGAIGNRWAYTEIADYSSDVSPENDDDIIHMLRLAQFFVRAANFHRTNAVPEIPHLVDKNGEVLIKFPKAIGSRVLEVFRQPEIGKC